MSKDLVALLRRPYGNLTFAEKQQVADLIEELEAKLAKAVEALRGWIDFANVERMPVLLSDLEAAELTGGKDELEAQRDALQEAVDEVTEYAKRHEAERDTLEAKLERIREEWANAVYGDLENGVASLNAAAATDFYKRYPLVSSFGETLNRIIDGED